MYDGDELLRAAYDYLAGRTSFGELYDIALTLSLGLFEKDPESLLSRLAAHVIHAEVLDRDRLLTPEEIRGEIADLLKGEALTHLREQAARP